MKKYRLSLLFFGILFSTMKINGKLIEKADDGNIQIGDFTNGIKFR
jgi:hypothetical protein